jgi:CubicO group peptidase (beta-lactamase class C family)
LPAPDPTVEFTRDLRRTQADARLPSVVAAVFSRGDTLWKDAVGLADAEAGEAATAEHQYRIGSITKTFTAAAIMQLRDAGELDIEDTLERHLPEAAHGTPSIRRLLSHLTGLQREVPGEIWESMEFPDRDGLFEAYRQAEQVLPPGAAYHYSNLAFALLGQVIERRSGLLYERYVETRLFEPVGLSRTTWNEAEPSAKGYLVDPHQDIVHAEPHVDTRAKRAAGQLWSTVRDLVRWSSFLAEPDPAVLRPETVAEMRGVQSIADHERWALGYGLGFQLYRVGDRVLFGHTGGMPGFSAAVFYSAKDRIGAATLANGTHGGKAVDLAVRLAARAAETLAPHVREWRPGAPAQPELEPLLGTWWSEGDEWVFVWRDGRLEAVRPHAPEWAPPAVFEREGDDRYRVTSGPERGELLRIVRDDSGQPVKLYWATYPFTRRSQAFGS